MTLRRLIAARHSVRLEDFDLGDRTDVEVVRLVRRIRSLPEVARSEGADVDLVDVGFPEGRGFCGDGGAEYGARRHQGADVLPVIAPVG
jgi:hypothetical protein